MTTETSQLEKPATRLLPTEREINIMLTIAKSAAAARVDGCTSQHEAFIRILAGFELGIPPAAAIQELAIQDGKISMSSIMMAALVKQKNAGTITVKQYDETGSILVMQAAGNPEIMTFTLSWSECEARKMNLTRKGQRKDTYDQHRAAMLYNRNLSAGCRVVFPDVIIGAKYVIAELDDDNGDSSGPVALQEIEDVPIAGFAPVKAENTTETAEGAADNTASKGVQDSQPTILSIAGFSAVLPPHLTPALPAASQLAAAPDVQRILPATREKILLAVKSLHLSQSEWDTFRNVHGVPTLDDVYESIAQNVLQRLDRLVVYSQIYATLDADKATLWITPKAMLSLDISRLTVLADEISAAFSPFDPLEKKPGN